MNKRIKVFVTSLHFSMYGERFSLCGYTTHTFWKGSFVKYGNVEEVSLQDCDIVCIFVTYLGERYVFDLELATQIAKLNKPIVIFDYSEYGGHVIDHLPQYNMYGYILETDGLRSGDYGLLHNFLCDHQSQIKCYFKRELSALNDLHKVPFRVKPIEFIGDVYHTDDTPSTIEEYFNRPCVFNFIWGYSNVSRPLFQGMMMYRFQELHAHLALSFRQVQEYLNNPVGKFIILVNHAWYERVNISELMRVQRNSYATVDLYGAGLKCFRNVESTANCLSIKQDPTKMVFTYPWIDGHNCITLPTLENSNILDAEKSINKILDVWKNNRISFYNMYLKSIDTNNLYRPKNYVPNHIIKNIMEVI